jgi:hypothetical protein
MQPEGRDTFIIGGDCYVSQNLFSVLKAKAYISLLKTIEKVEENREREREMALIFITSSVVRRCVFRKKFSRRKTIEWVEK